MIARKRIEFLPDAQAELRMIEQRQALSILVAIDRLNSTGEGDVVRLQGIQPPQLRLRVGTYRIRYQETATLLLILSVEHRKEAYRRLQ